MDIYSRTSNALEVRDTESGELAKQLLERDLLRESCWHQPSVLDSNYPSFFTAVATVTKVEL